MDNTIYVVKTKTLISFAVTAKLICVFVFAYAKSRFSHNAAHIFYYQGCKQKRGLVMLIGYSIDLKVSGLQTKKEVGVGWSGCLSSNTNLITPFSVFEFILIL